MPVGPDGEKLPSWERVVFGFLVAPLVPSLIFGPLALAVVFLYAYPAILLFAAPLYLLLRGEVRHSAWACVAGGAVVAVMPWLVFVVATEFGRSPGTSFGLNGVDHVVNGVRTAAGWRSTMLGSLEVAGLGAVAGAIFCICLRAEPPHFKPGTGFHRRPPR